MLLTAALTSSAVFGACSFVGEVGIGRGLVDVDVDERDAVAVDERAGGLHQPALGLDRDGEPRAREQLPSPSRSARATAA